MCDCSDGQVKEETIYGDYGACWVPCPKCNSAEVKKRKQARIDQKIKDLKLEIEKLERSR